MGRAADGAHGSAGASPSPPGFATALTRFPSLVALAAVAAAAVLYGAAFPPLGWGVCAWFALVPFLVAVHTATPLRAAGLAVVFAVLACATTITWLPLAAAGYFQQPVAVGLGIWLGVALAMIAPAVLVFTGVYRMVAVWPPVLRPLLGAAAWTATELGRTRLLGNPFALLGSTQVDCPLAIQMAEVTGSYGIGFVVVAVNVALAEAALAWRTRYGALAALQPGLAAALCVALQFAYGALRTPSPPASHGVPVLLVQGNVDVGTQWRDELFGRNLDVYMRLTFERLRGQPPTLVLWPENALTFFLADEPLYRQAIGRVLEANGSELIAGGPSVVRREPEQFFNSAFALAADGRLRAQYDKQRLLPFAEHFPIAGVDLLRRSFGRVREFTPGGPAVVLPTLVGPAGVLICNEILYPELAAARVRAGATLLVNLTNDSWIGDRAYAAAALDVAVLRAVEQRRWVLRVSTSGPSAVIDPGGRITARAEYDRRTTIAGTVTGGHAATVYARLGDAFAYGASVVAGITVLLAWRVRAAS